MRLLLSVGLTALLLIAGCSKDKDVEPPAELTKYQGTLPIKKIWGDNVGGGKKQVVLRLGLGPALDNGVVFAASHKGEVLAVAVESGKQVWLKKLKLPLSAGPAAGFGLVVVGSSKGTIVALDAASGAEKWRSRVNSELLSAPAIGEKVVVIRSVDGRLHGLDAANGKENWSVEQQVPRDCAGPGHLRLRQRQGDGGQSQHRRHRVGHGACLTARPHRAGSAGRRRFRGTGGRRECVRRWISRPHRHAGDRLGSDLVGPRHVELSRPDRR
jgi:hypothetical protein